MIVRAYIASGGTSRLQRISEKFARCTYTLYYARIKLSIRAIYTPSPFYYIHIPVRLRTARVHNPCTRIMKIYAGLFSFASERVSTRKIQIDCVKNSKHLLLAFARAYTYVCAFIYIYIYMYVYIYTRVPISILISLSLPRESIVAPFNRRSDARARLFVCNF